MEATQTNKTEEALSHVRVLLKYSPHSKVFHMEYIRLLTELNNIEAAQAELKKSANLLSTQDVHYLKAFIHHFQGDLYICVIFLKPAISLEKPP